MKWEPKNWGRVQHIFANPHACVSVLEVIPGQCCSIHMHEHRANQFCVQEGRLVIEEWRRGLKKESTMTVMVPGDVKHVPSGIFHRFITLDEGKLVEVYWQDGGEVKADDIIRTDVGTTYDTKELKIELVERGLL